MSTHTHPFAIGMPSTRSTPRLPQAFRSPAPASARTLPWLERLAAWAERQPMHHRLGDWTRP